MKKLSIFLVSALLLIFFSSTIFAQGKKKGDDNKTVKVEFEWTDYWQPVFCDGIQVDYLTGTVSVQWIVIQKDGNPVKTNVTMHGQASSNVSSEVFKVHDKELMVPDLDGIVYWHFNLKGNQGSHYIGSMIWDSVTGAMTVEKAICPGN